MMTAGPTEPVFNTPDEAIERIREIATSARTIWFVLLGFLAFAGTALLSVSDLDLFSIDATTQLPIVNIAIPTSKFFWSAAWMVALFHTYFLFYIVKLWDALAEAPPTVGRHRFGDRIFPWLVADWALRRRPDHLITARPMDWLADKVTLVVLWLATPSVLTIFWWRSMSAHDARLTLAIAAALALSSYASVSGWLWATKRLGDPGLRDNSANTNVTTTWPDYWWNGAIALTMMLVVISIVRSQIEVVIEVGKHRWSSLAPIDLANAEIARRPVDWRDRDVAERQFRIGWCRDHGLSLLDCAALDGSEGEAATRGRWCAANGVSHGCEAYFWRFSREFERDWGLEREAYLARIDSPELSGRDLRGASMMSTFLAGVNLEEARLEGAYLRRSRLEGANLWRSRLEGAHLGAARLEGAYLVAARLDGAFLWGARLEGADLRDVQLEGANLVWAQLQSIRWEGATIGASPAHSANFTGGRGLTQAQLINAIGNNETLLPRDAETGEQLFVWSCWTEPPSTLALLLRHWDESFHEDLLAEWLCAPAERPRPVGRAARE